MHGFYIGASVHTQRVFSFNAAWTLECQAVFLSTSSIQLCAASSSLLVLEQRKPNNHPEDLHESYWGALKHTQKVFSFDAVHALECHCLNQS